MPVAMKKEDVIFRFPDLHSKNVRIEDLRKVAFLQVLPDEKELRDVLAEVKNDRKLRQPYLKIGFINADLFLRIKDNGIFRSEHRYELKLKAGYRADWKKKHDAAQAEKDDGAKTAANAEKAKIETFAAEADKKKALANYVAHRTELRDDMRRLLARARTQLTEAERHQVYVARSLASASNELDTHARLVKKEPATAFTAIETARELLAGAVGSVKALEEVVDEAKGTLATAQKTIQPHLGTFKEAKAYKLDDADVAPYSALLDEASEALDTIGKLLGKIRDVREGVGAEVKAVSLRFKSQRDGADTVLAQRRAVARIVEALDGVVADIVAIEADAPTVAQMKERQDSVEKAIWTRGDFDAVIAPADALHAAFLAARTRLEERHAQVVRLVAAATQSVTTALKEDKETALLVRRIRDAASRAQQAREALAARAASFDAMRAEIQRFVRVRTAYRGLIGFPALWANPALREPFRAFTVTDYSTENLDLFEALESGVAHQEIYQKFFASNLVNDDIISRLRTRQGPNGTEYDFAAARDELLKNLRDVATRFKGTRPFMDALLASTP